MSDKNKISRISHDELFKRIWGDKENARNFFENYLPADILKKLDLHSIEVQQGSFVDEKLKAHHSDLLYRVKTLKNEAYIYILFEHKSYEDSNIHLQLLKYMTNIWSHNFKENKKLSPILPLVLYHGKKNWSVPVLFSELFEDLDASIRPYFPDFTYYLYDLSTYQDDKDIRGSKILQISMLLLKYILRTPEFKKKMPEFTGFFAELYKDERGFNYLGTLIEYAMMSRAFHNEEEFLDLVKREGENIMEYAKSILDQKLEAGIQIGLKKGWQGGLEKGWIGGKEEGIKIGIQTGLEKGLRYSIIDLFEVKFEDDNRLSLLKDKVEKIKETKRLEEIRSLVKKCNDPEEIIKILDA